ncbi:lytic transglycosylase domain-containing protein [Pseudoxanthomonas sp. CAU 1598]|uniref:Lytic transglycosylase domain-containing protein n=1 Tax=Pseudomarimonas arenosa TaxID=2774145 RepID=A0AAW3ZLU7_9GAMM|nr:lytic transglycosylase domain-containing protein [Pseudomarimonas arenosa]MBD8526152.1 lytic transglycosylase domain-containing protein [Pseudomarimonas arenosa]
MLVAFAALPPAEVSAGTLYRCTGAKGETAFTSSRVGYSNCKAVSTVPDAPPPARPAPVEGAQVEFRTATGEAAPAAPVAAEKPDRVTRGAVYRYIKDGVTHYTNRPPKGVRSAVLFTYIESCFACRVRSSVDFETVSLNTDSFVDEVATAAAEHGVDPAFVRAVIHAESAFRANAVSNKGAQGLMQLMPDTAKRFGVEDPFVPAQNINGGTQYLAWLLKRFKGNSKLAAAAYNSGEGAVDRFAGVPPYAETELFVERVGILHRRYGKALGPSVSTAVAAAGSAAPR